MAKNSWTEEEEMDSRGHGVSNGTRTMVPSGNRPSLSPSTPCSRLPEMRPALLEYCSPLQCFALAMVFSGFALVVILMAMFYTTVAPRCATSCGFSTTSIAGTPAAESIAEPETVAAFPRVAGGLCPPGGAGHE